MLTTNSSELMRRITSYCIKAQFDYKLIDYKLNSATSSSSTSVFVPTVLGLNSES